MGVSAGEVAPSIYSKKWAFPSNKNNIPYRVENGPFLLQSNSSPTTDFSTNSPQQQDEDAILVYNSLESPFSAEYLQKTVYQREENTLEGNAPPSIDEERSKPNSPRTITTTNYYNSPALTTTAEWTTTPAVLTPSRGGRDWGGISECSCDCPPCPGQKDDRSNNYEDYDDFSGSGSGSGFLVQDIGEGKVSEFGSGSGDFGEELTNELEWLKNEGEGKVGKVVDGFKELLEENLIPLFPSKAKEQSNSCQSAGSQSLMEPCSPLVLSKSN